MMAWEMANVPAWQKCGVHSAYDGNIKSFDFCARHLRVKPMAVRVSPVSSAREVEHCGSGSRELGKSELGQA